MPRLKGHPLRLRHTRLSQFYTNLVDASTAPTRGQGDTCLKLAPAESYYMENLTIVAVQTFAITLKRHKIRPHHGEVSKRRCSHF